ncbi:hypothetical protein TWF718_006836 [Orbilia javanica]|uniref:Uncharacterized protein n=1 Tax=Orbilia javanica TaxID=47235 RepID=A0AAN8MNJ9_9PEZI
MFFALPNLFLSTLLLGSTVNGVVIPYQEAHELEERTGSSGCNADNLLRLLRGQGNLPEALEFCSTWVGNVPKTITLTEETVTPTVTSTSLSFSTIYYNMTNTNTNTHTEFTTITNTKTLTETITVVTITVESKKKRARAASKTPLSDQILSNTYPASRISSACNCLTLEPAPTATVYATETAAPVTEVVVLPAVVATAITFTDYTDITTTLTSALSTTTITTLWVGEDPVEPTP